MFVCDNHLSIEQCENTNYIFEKGANFLNYDCVFTNNFELSSPNKDCKDFIIKNCLTPRISFYNKLSNIKKSLHIEDNDYYVIHIRLNDNETYNENRFNNIMNIIFSIKQKHPNNKLLLIASNEIYLNQINLPFIIKTNLNRGHVGLNTTTLKECEDTMIEFMLMTTCKQIYQLSVYSWGSGFSDTINKLYDIPVNKYDISSLNTIINKNFDISSLNTIINKNVEGSSLNTISKKIKNINEEFYNFGILAETDKIKHHGYHNFYPKVLEKYRDTQNLAMLEIGVENKFSINLWLNYFKNSFIYGIDINVSDEGERYKIFKADQSNENNLKEVIKNISHPLFFVIDDGSHIPEHQILSFDHFFELLQPGGVYIIEDIETSYWSKNHIYNYLTNYGYHHPNSVVEFFKLLIEDVNSEYLKNENISLQNKFIRNRISENNRKRISSITFCHNCIIIEKKTDSEYSFYLNRQYNFFRNL